MDQPLITVAIDAEADYALLAVGLAWVAIVAVLVAGVVAEAWRQLRAWRAVLIEKEVDMFWMIRNAGEHFIELGRVQCPRAGCDVELDKCLGCEYVKEVKGGRMPSVVCNPPTRIVPAAY
jgi:hypothetical protein